MNNLPARTGWEWLKGGMGLFRKQPAALTTLLLANTLFSLFLSYVPIVGPILTVVLIPSFAMAFMQACLLIDNGTRVTPDVLLTGFRQNVLGTLCKIGLIYLVVSVVLVFILLSSVPVETLQQFTRPPDPAHPPEVPRSMLLTVLGVCMLNVTALILLCFAAPLACWKGMAAGKAAFYSFFAVLRTARVFFVMLSSWFGLFLVVGVTATFVFQGSALGQVVTMWIFFLCVLLLQCAMYVGYREIFGKPNVPGAGVKQP